MRHAYIATYACPQVRRFVLACLLTCLLAQNMNRYIYLPIHTHICVFLAFCKPPGACQAKKEEHRFGKAREAARTLISRLKNFGKEEAY